MEENQTVRESKSSGEKIYTQKQVRELLKEKNHFLEVQYSVLKETYQELLIVKKENEALKEKLQGFESPEDGYRKDWTWVAKIVFALESVGKPLRSTEIIEILEKREPYLREHPSKKQYFSAFLNLAMKNGRINRVKRKGERGFYYLV